MKNDDQMYQSVLSRYAEYQETKKNRRKLAIKRTVPVLACFCLTIALGVGYWDHFKNLPHIPVQPNIIEEPTIETPDTTTSTNNTPNQTEKITELPTTFATVHSSEAEHIASTEAMQTETVTTVATNVESTVVTEPDVDKPAETQIPVTTAPVIQTTIIQTTMNNEQQTTTPIQTTEETTVTTINNNIHEIKFGYKDDNGGQSSPSTSKRIVMKCLSFCELGKALSVDVAMADGSFRPINDDSPIDYVYEVYVCNPLNFQNIEDDKILINGNRKEYRREYLKEEFEFFDINGQYDDYDLYHHELTEIDFSCYEQGDSGCIKFSFMKRNTKNPLHPTFMGAIQFMYFYVGEQGTSISNLSIEDAISNYQTVTSS